MHILADDTCRNIELQSVMISPRRLPVSDWRRIVAVLVTTVRRSTIRLW